ncbi:MAG: hypothetical protein ABI690_33045 [Chloroflexota bacterium]
MTRLLVSLLPYIIIGLYVIAILVFVLSLQQLRRGRTGSYWRLRRTAGQRGGQLFLLAIALIGIASALALFSGLADLAYRRLTGTLVNDPDIPKGVVLPSITPPLLFTTTPTAIKATPSVTVITLSSTPTRIQPSETAAPSATSSATLTPSDTLTPTNTPIPSATFESVLALTPRPSQRQPRAGASIKITSAAQGVAADQSPTQPGTQFSAGVQRVYFFFDYQTMDDGIGWSRILFRDGIPIQGQSYLWSLGESGSSYFFFGSEDGYPPGEYEARLYVGDQEASALTFSVVAP